MVKFQKSAAVICGPKTLGICGHELFPFLVPGPRHACATPIRQVFGYDQGRMQKVMHRGRELADELKQFNISDHMNPEHAAAVYAYTEESSRGSLVTQLELIAPCPRGCSTKNLIITLLKKFGNQETSTPALLLSTSSLACFVSHQAFHCQCQH